MATHINAYFADVEQAKLAVTQAEAELKAAEQRLEAKKLEEGYQEEVEPESVPDVPETKEKETETSRERSSLFTKKR